MPITPDDLNNWFKYHAPADTAPVKDVPATTCYETIRASGLEFARTILAFTPPSADQTTAIRKIREAVMTANAAIACGGR